MSETIGFFYLKTGGGHSSGAHSLKSKISQMYPDARCVEYDPFAKRALLSSLFFEKGYFLTSNYLGLCYLLFYRLTSYNFMLKFAQFAYRRFFVRRFVHFLKKEKVRRVVCFHEILVCHLREAIDIVDPSIKLITIVMDPFTAHPVWFYEKRTHLVVFSKKLEKEAIEKYHFSKEMVKRFSIMLSDKFDVPYTEAEKEKVKAELGISQNKKIVLIAGGGEGLRNATRILYFFLKQGVSCHVIVVCGKNKKLKKLLDAMVEHYHAKNVSIFGFVSFMPALMNIADCIISKSGPATIMESLSLAKPLILCSYVRGQELGNRLYVQIKKAGWYLPHSRDVVEKAKTVLEGNLDELQRNIKALDIQNGVADIARFVMTL